MRIWVSSLPRPCPCWILFGSQETNSKTYWLIPPFRVLTVRNIQKVAKACPASIWLILTLTVLQGYSLADTIRAMTIMYPQLDLYEDVSAYVTSAI